MAWNIYRIVVLALLFYLVVWTVQLQLTVSKLEHAGSSSSSSSQHHHVDTGVSTLLSTKGRQSGGGGQHQQQEEDADAPVVIAHARHDITDDAAPSRHETLPPYDEPKDDPPAVAETPVPHHNTIRKPPHRRVHPQKPHHHTTLHTFDGHNENAVEEGAKAEHHGGGEKAEDELQQQPQHQKQHAHPQQHHHAHNRNHPVFREQAQQPEKEQKERQEEEEAPAHHAAGKKKPRRIENKEGNDNAAEEDASHHSHDRHPTRHPREAHQHHHQQHQAAGHHAPQAAHGTRHSHRNTSAHHHRHHRLRHHRYTPEEERVDLHGDKVAYAVVVANEDFIDGALVLAWSFANHSYLWLNNQASLVAIVAAEAVSDASVERLHCAGWNHVVRQHDLKLEAPRSVWAPTLNKLYLFNLTEYDAVAYFDVDMLMLRNPDIIFRHRLPDQRILGALGNNPKSNKPYFQTGVMLIKPHSSVFDWLMNEFHTNPAHKSINGRDGAIIRKYFGARYINIDDSLSAHLKILEPLDGVIGFHYRGDWKPWFNKEEPPTTLIQKGTNHLATQEMGPAYRLWWDTYEDMHVKVFSNESLSELSRLGQQPPPKEARYDAKVQVWLLRNTNSSYVQYLRRVDVERRNLTYYGLVLEKSNPGESCEKVCALRQGLCVERALQFSEINTCKRLGEYFGCRRCTQDHPGREQPAFDGATKTCLVNPLYYALMRPNCTAKHRNSQRLCPCLPLDHAYQKPVSFGVLGLKNKKKDALGDDEDDYQNTPEEQDSEQKHKESQCFPSRTDKYGDTESDTQCSKYLTDRANFESVLPLGRSLFVGRTAKLLVRYKEQSVSAVVKFPQKSFPHEAQSEFVAYHVDRLLGINRIPPTGFMFLPKGVARKGFQLEEDEEKEREKEGKGTTSEEGGGGGGNVRLKSQVDFLEEQVFQYVDGMKGSLTNEEEDHAGSEGAAGAGAAGIGVSVQVWLNDVHRLADTKLRVPKDYLSWFAGGEMTEDPDPTKYPLHNTSMYELSRMFVFDYIIANDDRSANKNCYVVGGCQKMCRGSTPLRHSGEPQLVLIDQGRSIYFDSEPEGNPLSASGGDGSGSGDDKLEKKPSQFCKFPRSLIESLRRYSRKKDVDDEGSSAGNVRKDTTTTTLEAALLKVLPDHGVVSVVGKKQFAAMQDRLEDLLIHVKKCVGKHGEKNVLVWE